MIVKKLLASLLLVVPLLASAQQLTVSAAASLNESFKAIAARFEAGRPGAQVRLNFAASGALLQQIGNGAPVDVFASADQETMDRGAALWLEGTRRDFAVNALVLVTAPDAKLQRISELMLPAVRRVAIGKPASVPAGRYAQQTLRGLQLWEPLQPKLVFADNVRQVLDYVARGEVEAGFVYRSDAGLLPGKVRIAAVASGHAPIRYPVAVVKDSRQPQLARDFIAFLAGPEAQALLLQAGFDVP
jgi:molybdate transport system substrate-binding protein